MTTDGMVDVSDEVIVTRVQQGQVDDFAIILERYRPRLLRYARKFLYNYDDIEDAVQEVFVKTYVHIQSFDPAKSFSPWIYRIAHNTFINVIKKIGREPITLFDADVLFQLPAKENTSEEYMRAEDAEQISVYIERLDPKYREPIILFYFEEKSYQEIADIMRIPVSTVGIRIRRARTQLSKYYQTT